MFQSHWKELHELHSNIGQSKDRKITEIPVPKSEKLCPHCGHLCSETKFCSECGYRFAEETQREIFSRFIHDLAPISILRAFYYILLRPLLIVEKIDQVDIKNISRPLPYFLACMSFFFISGKLFVNVDSDVRWESIYASLEEYEKVILTESIGFLAQRYRIEYKKNFVDEMKRNYSTGNEEYAMTIVKGILDRAEVDYADGYPALYAISEKLLEELRPEAALIIEKYRRERAASSGFSPETIIISLTIFLIISGYSFYIASFLTRKELTPIDNFLRKIYAIQFYNGGTNILIVSFWIIAYFSAKGNEYDREINMALAFIAILAIGTNYIRFLYIGKRVLDMGYVRQLLTYYLSWIVISVILSAAILLPGKFLPMLF